ncbi:5-oxoprolinase subunit PxpB [Thalassobacillus hwangdonensis]|uniref:5-oxoprolinase subunit PxpB n=1 Tax=Thalassobacillus hwangdonensis TaxID=546108 RepID=A0ABW3L3U6_9BACI
MEAKLNPLGDQAIVIELADTISLDAHERVKQVTNYLDHENPEWMVEYVPAFTTVTVFYEPLKICTYITEDSPMLPYDWVVDQLKTMLMELKENEHSEPRTVKIPVCYGGDLGPDLKIVADENGLSEQEVIERHMNGDYLVYMIGFAPGFPYIGGMDETIATPRKDDPRLAIPEGSVGIAGKQTGVYPIETPGGWQLIGRTPLKLFRPDAETPSLLKAGDKVIFESITEEEYRTLKEEES